MFIALCRFPAEAVLPVGFDVAAKGSGAAAAWGGCRAAWGGCRAAWGGRPGCRARTAAGGGSPGGAGQFGGTSRGH